MKNIYLTLTALVTTVTAGTVQIRVSQDTWVGMIETDKVLQNIAPRELRVSTPGNYRAYQYNRRAVFGFDLSAVDLASVSGVTFSAKTVSNIDTHYDSGYTLRAYLVSNKLDDKFSQFQATGSSLVAAGFYKEGNVQEDQVSGITIGDYTTSGSASNQKVNFTFGAEAIGDLKADSNRFAVVIVEARTGSNVGYSQPEERNRCVAFESLETSGGEPATLTFQYVQAALPSPIISIHGMEVGLN